MRRTRDTMHAAEMNVPSVTQNWPVANVVLAQYDVEIAEVGIKDNDGNWFDAYIGAKDVNYGKSVGVRARARNISPVTAFCSITVYLVRPDGTKGIAATWSGNVAAAGLTGYSTFAETANQIGLYSSIVVAVISAKV